MTVLNNSIHIAAPPERVWAALARLDALQHYDPGVATSKLESDRAEGIGAARHCDLRGGGWFREKVTVWVPHRELELEFFAGLKDFVEKRYPEPS